MLDPLLVPFKTSPSLHLAVLLPPQDVVALAPVSSKEVLLPNEDEEDVDSEASEVSLLSSLPLSFGGMFARRAPGALPFY